MKPIIALDADGVLHDYRRAYARAWAKAFGALAALRDALANWPIDRRDVQPLAGDEVVKRYPQFLWITCTVTKGKPLFYADFIGVPEF